MKSRWLRYRAPYSACAGKQSWLLFPLKTCDIKVVTDASVDTFKTSVGEKIAVYVHCWQGGLLYPGLQPRWPCNALQGSNFSWGFDICWFSFGQLCLNPIWKRKVCCVVNAGLPNKGALRNCCPRLSPEWQPCRLAAIPSVRRALVFSKFSFCAWFLALFESDPEYDEWKRCLIIKAMWDDNLAKRSV